MKVLIICLFASVLIHGVALFFLGPNKSKTIYPVELQLGVVEVKTISTKKLSSKKSNFDNTNSTQPDKSFMSPGPAQSGTDSTVTEDAEASVEMQTDYPEMSRMRGEEEEIKVKVYVNESGKVEKILFISEPKYPRLKKAVQEAISKAQFEATKSIANLKFNFKLK
jgi:TonB family protein